MSLSNILLLLLVLMLSNKVLSRILKKSEGIKMDKVQNFNLYANEEFDMLVKRYFNKLGYTNLIDDEKGEMIVYNNEEVLLVGYKQVQKLDEEVSKHEIMNFIASMSLKSTNKGRFITNGRINKDIKNIIKENNSNFELEFIDGTDLLIEFNKIKLQMIRNELDEGEMAI